MHLGVVGVSPGTLDSTGGLPGSGPAVRAMSLGERDGLRGWGGVGGGRVRVG